MILHHSTTAEAARAILAEGWRGGSGSYGMAATRFEDVVFLADTPLDWQDGAEGDVVLAVDVGDLDLSDFEIIEEPKGFREWAVPAAILNALDHPPVVVDPET